MIIKFPDITQIKDKNSFLFSDKIVFARYRKENSTDKRSVYLTENTIVFVLKGKKQLHFSDHTLAVNENNIIILKKGVYLMSEYLEGGLTFEALMLFFSDKFLREFFYRNKIANKTNKSSTNKSYLVIPTDDLLNSFKQQYINYFKITINNFEQLHYIKLTELFLLLFSGTYKSTLVEFYQSVINKKLLDVEFIVKSYLLLPLSISDYANLSGRSLSTFKRDFQKEFGTSPKKWINEQRLSIAHIALKETNKTVSEIAYDSGFNNISHFIRSFKLLYKMTPKEVRSNKSIV